MISIRINVKMIVDKKMEIHTLLVNQSNYEINFVDHENLVNLKVHLDDNCNEI